MGFQIDEDRAERYAKLRVERGRVRKINMIALCASFLMVFTLFVVIFNALRFGGEDQLYALLFFLTVLFQMTGCLKRSWVLNAMALAVYLIAAIAVAKVIPSILFWLPIAAAIYANYVEWKLSQEEGYPDFDPLMRKDALIEEMEIEANMAILRKKRAAEKAETEEE